MDPHVPATPSRTNNILYETFFGGAIGGSVLALLFLASDAVRGEPLMTPSVLGSTLLFGTPLEFVEPMRLEAVALFSIVHFALFGVLGLIASLLVRAMESNERRPVWVTIVLFAIMEAGFFLPLMVLAPEVPGVIGEVRVSVINLATAASMVAFLHHAHRVEEVAEAEARGEETDYDALGGIDRTSVWVPPFVDRQSTEDR